MLDRLLRFPVVVYTELALSILLVFVGLGEKLWGNGPHPDAAGNFILTLAAVCLAFSLTLLVLLMVRRRRRQ